MSIMNPEDRRLKFPYTFTSKIWYMPWAYYHKHAWLVKYYVYGLICTFPIMYKITKAVNTPENKAKWDEIHRKEFSGESH